MLQSLKKKRLKKTTMKIDRWRRHDDIYRASFVTREVCWILSFCSILELNWWRVENDIIERCERQETQWVKDERVQSERFILVSDRRVSVSESRTQSESKSQKQRHSAFESNDVNRASWVSKRSKATQKPFTFDRSCSQRSILNENRQQFFYISEKNSSLHEQSNHHSSFKTIKELIHSVSDQAHSEQNSNSQNMKTLSFENQMNSHLRWNLGERDDWMIN